MSSPNLTSWLSSRSLVTLEPITAIHVASWALRSSQSAARPVRIGNRNPRSQCLCCEILHVAVATNPSSHISSTNNRTSTGNPQAFSATLMSQRVASRDNGTRTVQPFCSSKTTTMTISTEARSKRATTLRWSSCSTTSNNKASSSNYSSSQPI